MSSFCHVTGYWPIATQTGNGFGSPKPQYVLAVFAVNAPGSWTPRFRIAEPNSIESKNIIDGVSKSNANCQNIIQILLLTLITLHTQPSLSWPSHRCSTTWPVTLACALALPETVSGRVFGKISRAGFLCYETQPFTSPWELLVIITICIIIIILYNYCNEIFLGIAQMERVYRCKDQTKLYTRGVQKTRGGGGGEVQTKQ